METRSAARAHGFCSDADRRLEIKLGCKPIRLASLPVDESSIDSSCAARCKLRRTFVPNASAVDSCEKDEGKARDYRRALRQQSSRVDSDSSMRNSVAYKRLRTSDRRYDARYHLWMSCIHRWPSAGSSHFDAAELIHQAPVGVPEAPSSTHCANLPCLELPTRFDPRIL